MSFLLDALRKSELERKVGEVPNLTPDLLPQPVQSKRHSVVLLIIMLVLINIGTLFYVTRLDPQRSGDSMQNPSVPATRDPGNENIEDINPRSVSENAENKKTPAHLRSDIEPRRPEQSVARTKTAQVPTKKPTDTNNNPAASAGATKGSATIPGKRIVDIPEKPSSAPRLAQDRINRSTPSRIKPGNIPTKPLQSAKLGKPSMKPDPRIIDPPERASRQNADLDSEPSKDSIVEPHGRTEIPLLSGMPRGFQREVPSFDINVFVYSEDPEERFVIVNMSKYLTGEKIDNGPEIQEIRPDSLVLNYLGRTFQIKRP